VNDRETFDFVVIGAGGAGQAATYEARRRGATVAVIDRDLFGGSCPHWACIPSKSLLHSASVHHAGGDYPWSRASDRRDWNINRVGLAYPDDSSTVTRLTDAGATVIRGAARLTGPGRVTITHESTTHEIQGTHVVLAVGSVSRVPDLPGLEEAGYWTNREATSVRELPSSLLVLGGGPTGVELAQAFARYGVPVTIVDSNPRILIRDHPLNSAILQRALEDAGVTVITGARAVRVQPGSVGQPHTVEFTDGRTASAQTLMLAIGRMIPLADLGLVTIGLDPAERLTPDERLQLAPGVWVAGDPAGPEMHTHLAHYQGELVVAMALGDDVRPDFGAIPRATYTDPETSSVGMQVDQARERGIDAVEFVQDLATTAKGYTAEADGHVAIVVDRANRVLVGAFLAGPGASEAIHEAVLAVKTRTPLSVLADTIHAFPTLARVMGSLFVTAHRST
jgi:pyruvate/2-oxoglutarate dehydrogenase complex dihydrolipoamide dehydrogenase (E3) component